MRIWVQKSLKTELRLKRNENLKLYGLKCKMAGTGFESVLKIETRLQFVKSSGSLV
jgi:hypothetical protein